MQQTLFLIPTSWFNGPLLIGWLVLGAIIMAVMAAKYGLGKDLLGFLPMYGIVAALIWFVLPQLQIEGLDPASPGGPMIKQGLAIRGYGFCLLLAMSSAVGIIYIRCRQTGFDFDKTLSLTFWMIVCGIIGARVFYVVQKWDEFNADTPQKLVMTLLDMTKGGLVVYGSLIGGMLAAIVFFRVTKLPWRKAIDVVAPAMVLGLAIGRLGCLMNGCCYGGICDSQIGLSFPAGSPPYVHQLQEGRLLGVTASIDDKNDYPIKVETVAPDSLAEQYGIAVKDRIFVAAPDSLQLRAVHHDGLELDPVVRVYREGSVDEFAKIPVSDLPSQSLKVHPTQIYSSISAFLLAAFLWFYYPRRSFDGEVFALLIIIYPVVRFILEAIRVDEGGQLNTGLTISQIVSIILIVIGLGFWTLLRIRSEKPEPISA